MPDLPTSVYRFYDENGKLLYVGITSVGADRWYFHSRAAPWWTMAKTVTLEHHATRKSALERETYAIKTEKPMWNRAGRPKVDDPVPMPVLHWDEPPPVRTATKAEVRERFTIQIRKEFGLSPEEFMARVEAGEVDLSEDRFQQILSSMEGLYW